MGDPAPDALVVGGGPAGAATAIRLAQLGYRVLLADRGPGRRGRLPHHLAPTVEPLLAAIGAGTVPPASGALASLARTVAWGGPPAVVEERPAGTLISRAAFDTCLLEVAGAAGVDIRRPAVVARAALTPGRGWAVELNAGGTRSMVQCRYLVDASGGRFRPEQPPVPGGRVATAPATTALCGWWPANGGRSGGAARDDPGWPAASSAVVTIDNAWVWTARTRPGRLFAAVFVDSESLVGVPPSIRAERYAEAVASAGLGLGAAGWSGTLTACDATPRRHLQPAGPDFVTVGNAAVAGDPLSAQGVVDALRSAMQGAAVLHTMATRPDDTDLAVAFLANAVARTAKHHQRLAAGHYAVGGTSAFFRRRAAAGEKVGRAPVDGTGGGGEQSGETIAEVVASPEFEAGPALGRHDVLGWSADTRLTPTASLVDNVIQLRPALSHPALDEPASGFGDHPADELYPLIDGRRTAAEVIEVLASQGWGPHGPSVLASLHALGVLEALPG